MKVRRIDFYPADWLAGTGKLNGNQIAVYITVCVLVYDEGGPIERDDADLARRLRWRKPIVTRIVESLKAARKLHEDVSGLYCRRCVDELERARKRHEDASNAASQRWNNNNLTDATASGAAVPSRAGNNLQSSIESPLSPPKGARRRYREREAEPSQPTEPKPCKLCGQTHATLDEFKAAHPVNGAIIPAPDK